MKRHTRFPNSPAPGQNTLATAAAASRTPESQSLDSVTTEAILAKLSKAKEIESQLETMAAEQKAASKRGGSGSKSDEKPQALRLQLCELLSDVILNDSTLAESNDAIGRLWKHCFYGRINDIRSRIAKEKSRAKKRQATGAGAAEAAKKMVGDLDKQLKQFLKEAIQLYKYIIERYVKELMPMSQSQQSPLSEMSQIQADEDERERSLVVIASLYRMHIHLGDLHRYSSSPKHAEECYLRACKLAPGTGNPFNQLAVVAQGQQSGGDSPTTAVALYYYARSLMASRSPFETSRSNLVRLFESNRKWLEEHCRDDDKHARGILNVGNAGGNKRDRREQKEMINRERTTMNRKALARMVDLQWDFFSGVSLDDIDTNGNKKIDLDSLMNKMSSLLETFSNLISHASFSESLLNKIISVIAFSTLGASTSGKLINLDGMNAKRRKDPTWDLEGEIMTNQALAFSFLLKACAMLARDVDGVISKKIEAASASSGDSASKNSETRTNKLGSIRALSPLLLGFRFAMSIYEGCEWFHGLAFYPASIGSDAGSGSEGLEGNAIYKLCKESHVDFWKSIASMANHLDKLPSKKKKRDEVDQSIIINVKDFAEFHGYIPFASFLDKSASAYAAVVSTKKTKYATADEVIDALTDTHPSSGGGRGGVEAETNMKINIFLSITDNKTWGNGEKSNTNHGEVFYLTRDPNTGDRAFLDDAAATEDEEDEEDLSDKELTQSPPNESSNDGSMSPVQSPYVPEDNMDVDTTEVKEGGKVDDNNEMPLKMSYSEKGMALLTPAALLASAGAADKPKSPQPINVALNKERFLPIDSVLDNIELPSSNLNAAGVVAATSASNGLLNPATFSRQQPQQQLETAAKAALPPPPGFSIQPQQTPQQQPALLAPSTATGISLAQFTTVPPQAQQSGVGGMMPQAGLPSYASSGMFETMNPFAQIPALSPSPYGNDFIASSTSSQGLLNMAQGVNLQQKQPQSSNKGGLDSTLDFLLSNNTIQPAGDKPASISNNALDLLMTPAASSEPEDPSESILNFLFSDVATSSSQGEVHQPLYAANRGHHASPQHGVPPTKNPFAT